MQAPLTEDVLLTALTNLKVCSIPLDHHYLERHTAQQVEGAIRQMVASVGFRLLPDGHLHITGQDTSYNRVDPWLPQALTHFRSDLTPSNTLSYCVSEHYFNLFCEDSWSGYFIAESIWQQHHTDLVLLHLDDHADMMPTLLASAGDARRDPIRDVPFDPHNLPDWSAAISSGAVCIGNHVTALFHRCCHVHVRHLRERGPHTALQQVSCSIRRYEIAPTIEFADIALTSATPNAVGTYMAQPDPVTLLRDMPLGALIIHIDLDYFINDFNGSFRGDDYCPDTSLRVIAQQRIDRFFTGLSSLDRPVVRWLIATSPGFCCAQHWEWLIANLRSRIEAFEASREALP